MSSSLIHVRNHDGVNKPTSIEEDQLLLQPSQLLILLLAFPKIFSANCEFFITFQAFCQPGGSDNNCQQALELSSET
jgi:hypothetical protein